VTIGFAEIAATSPADAAGMVRHLLNNTLGQGRIRLASYYNRGGEGESHWYELAEQVIAGDLEWGDAVDCLMAEWYRRWDTGDNDAIYTAQMAYGDRLDHVIERVEAGLAYAPLAVIRPDIEAGVMLGLGLQPGLLLNEQEINHLLAGRRVDGEKIDGKHYAVERTLPVGKQIGGRKYSTPIGSYDFCPTPDKSVSIAWAFADDVQRAKIYNAHIQAAREAVGHIADTVGVARYGKGGQGGREAGAVAWLEFTHHTSRRVQIVSGEGRSAEVTDAGLPGDMNLHTHFLIPNAVFTPSGKVGSLDTMAIGGLIFEADGFYHARLATKLRDAGFDVELDHKTGAARLSIIPEHVREHFSKKTRDGELQARKVVADAGLDWDMLPEWDKQARVKHETQRVETKMKTDGRQGPGAKDDVADFDDWRRQAKEIRWEIPKTFELIGPQLRPLTRAERARTAYEIGLDWLDQRLQHEAVLTHYDLRRAILRGLVHTGMSDLNEVSAGVEIMKTEGVRQSGDMTPIIWGQDDAKRVISVSTGLHEAEEKEFIALAKAAAADRSGAIPAALLQQKVAASGLDFSDTHGKAQLAAIERIAGGGKLGVIIASAGAGKTASVQALVASWGDQQRDVWGTSLGSRQTDDLIHAGIAKHRLWAASVLLDKLDAAEVTLTRTSVVVVDELGLLGTREGLRLLRHRAKVDATVVALGDPRQCQSLAAGSVVDLTKRALGSESISTILTTRRQRSERERQIAGLFRDGKAAEALDMKRSDGTAIMATGGRDGTIAAVAQRYVARLKEDSVAPLIVAPTNSDAQHISAAVRHERRKLGTLGDDIMTVRATDGARDYSLPIAKGDRVRLFASTGADYGNGKGGAIGRNGSLLEVVAADTRSITLKASTGTVGRVAWDRLRAEAGDRIQLAYGDCQTIHTAQGSTAHGVIFAMPSGSQAVNGNTGYTAATRHKDWCEIITSEAAERMAVRQVRPINDTHEITQDDKWSAVASRFALLPERGTATAMMERVREVKRGAVSLFHQTGTPDPRLRPAYQRARVARQASEIVQRRKLDLIMETVQHALHQIPWRTINAVQQANDIWRATRRFGQQPLFRTPEPQRARRHERER
jgi:hypothetical protein